MLVTGDCYFATVIPIVDPWEWALTSLWLTLLYSSSSCVGACMHRVTFVSPDPLCDLWCMGWELQLDLRVLPCMAGVAICGVVMCHACCGWFKLRQSGCTGARMWCACTSTVPLLGSALQQHILCVGV